LTDPQAAWVARPGMDPFFAYDVNYLIDNKLGIILDAEGTRANRIAEIAVTQTMVERVSRRFDLRPQRLAGDTVYGAVSCSSGWWIARSRRLCLRPAAQHLRLPRWRGAHQHRQRRPRPHRLQQGQQERRNFMAASQFGMLGGDRPKCPCPSLLSISPWPRGIGGAFLLDSSQRRPSSGPVCFAGRDVHQHQEP
jgi:hypothetical protein